MGDIIDLSVVIPAYNEAKRIGPTLEIISTYLNSAEINYEIIVVSDGSGDSTDAVVQGYAQENKEGLR